MVIAEVCQETSELARDSPLGRSHAGHLASWGQTGYIIGIGKGITEDSFFSFFLSLPVSGGELVAYETQLALFFRDTINIVRIFDSFYDIRMHPRIRLKDIFISVFLMP